MSAALGALRTFELAAAHWNKELEALLSSLDQALADPAGGALRQTAMALSARLHLMRAAIAPLGMPLGPNELAALGMGLAEGIALDTAAIDPAARFQPPFGRVLLNLLLLAAESLPSGGVVRLAGSADEVFLQIAGPAAGWPDGTALCLADLEAASRALHEGRVPRASVAAILAQEAGLRLSTLLTPHAAVPPILRLSAA